MTEQLLVRRARPEDAGRLAVLSGQLGYPSDEEQVRARLLRLHGRADDLVLVADDGTGHVIGWVHACRHAVVVVDPVVEVKGLVVDEGHRGRGVGARLMAEAERWARDVGCDLVMLRSNVIREAAHGFYRRLGYEVSKQQLTFRKELQSSSISSRR